MRCKKAESLLSAYLDAELAGQSQDALKQHLSGCPACRTKLEELRADHALLKSVPPPEPSVYLVTRAMAEIRAGHAQRQHLGLRRALSTVAAALLIAISAGVGTFVGVGLADQSSHHDSGGLLEIGTTDPVVELAQTVVGGE